MSYKKFIIILATVSIGLASIVSTIVYIIDPLFYFRKTDLYEPQYNATERYQMPGFLRNNEYETLITATSMGRNFRESYVDQALETTSFNGSLPSSTAKEQAMVAELGIREQHVKHIIWELNYYSFSGDPDWVAGPPSDFPKYMYDTSRMNDIRYLFNSYSLEVLFDNLTANENGDKSKRKIKELYKFGKNAPIETFSHVESTITDVGVYKQLPIGERSETLIHSFRNVVIPVIEANPDTKFTFFFAPYPIYNFVKFEIKHPDLWKERIEFKKQAYIELSKYSNVEFYDFQDQKEITFNIANYMGDSIHYYEFINQWIIDQFTNESPIQSEKEYEVKLTNLYSQIKGFSMNQLVENESLKRQYVSIE